MILLVLTYPLRSQTENLGFPFIENFDRSDYSLGLHPFMMSQSDKGLIYAANDESLASFDGYQWNKHEVPLWTNVLSVLAATDGKLYVGCTNTFGYFQSEPNGNLQFHSLLDQLPPDQREFNEVWKIHETKEGIIFQSVNQLMILKEGQVKVVEAPSTLHFSFYTRGQLYVTDYERGILSYLDGEFIELAGTQSLVDKEVTAILPLDTELLIATQFDGLYLYGESGLRPWKSPVASQLKRDQVYCALKIDNQRIAFGTIQNGLLISTHAGLPVLSMNELNGLQSNTIQSIMLDASGDLWLGTNSGIDLVHISRPLTMIKQQGGIGTGYAAILHEGYLYLGTNRGVFFQKWEPSLGISNEEAETDFQLIPQTKGQVWKLQAIGDELFCGHHDGTFLIKGGAATKISDYNGVWTFLETGKKDRILAGTYTGLISFDYIEGRWQFSGKLPGFEESSRVMAYEQDGSLWMSHGYKGVFHLQLSPNHDRVIKVDRYNSRNGFPTDYGLQVFTIGNEIVFLTPSGIYEFAKDKQRIQVANRYEDFFPFPDVGTAFEDEQRNIWYFSQGKLGVKRWQEDGSYNDIRLPYHTIRDQFVGGFEFIYPIDPKNVLIAAEKGFFRYNPSLAKNYRKPFHAFLRLIKSIKKDAPLLNGHLFGTDSLTQELSHEDNHLLFSFYAADFEDFQNLEFTTYLEGYDQSWSPWDGRTDREFTNLKEGTYQLQLKARNTYHAESEIVSYSFVILPPVYRSTSAYALYLLGLVLVVLITRQQIRRKHRLQLMKRETELQQEKILAEQELIQLRNEQLQEKVKNKDQELANSTMQIIQKNRFLKGLKKKLVDLSKETNEAQLQRKVSKLLNSFDQESKSNESWKLFEAHFANVHGEFLAKLKADYPKLSPAELRLCACLRMNISSKEIAELLNISMRSVESGRYRLRKSLHLERDANLTEFILAI